METQGKNGNKGKRCLYRRSNLFANGGRRRKLTGWFRMKRTLTKNAATQGRVKRARTDRSCLDLATERSMAVCSVTGLLPQLAEICGDYAAGIRYQLVDFLGAWWDVSETTKFFTWAVRAATFANSPTEGGRTTAGTACVQANDIKKMLMGYHHCFAAAAQQEARDHFAQLLQQSVENGIVSFHSDDFCSYHTPK